jgi:F-type H+-transporting ATPase subunit delta
MRAALSAFAGAWKKSEDLRETMANPAIPLDQRVSIIRDIAKSFSSTADLSGFLALLVENSRIAALPEIATAFSGLVDQAKHLLALEIRSAFPLDDTEKNSILARVQQDFGSLAAVSWHVDPSLIGGITVKSGDKLLDGSVRGSLERVRTLLQA